MIELSKILLIDDNESDRELLKRILANINPDVSFIEAENALQARPILEKDSSFSCIFLDYTMPYMDGLEFLKLIYDEEKQLAPAPIIFLTGNHSEHIAIEAIQNGAQDYLVKDNISYEVIQVTLIKALKAFQLASKNYASRKAGQ